MRGPCTFGRHKRWRGPRKRATGPGSYDSWKAELAAERARKRTANTSTGGQ